MNRVNAVTFQVGGSSIEWVAQAVLYLRSKVVVTRVTLNPSRRVVIYKSRPPSHRGEDLLELFVVGFQLRIDFDDAPKQISAIAFQRCQLIVNRRMTFDGSSSQNLQRAIYVAICKLPSNFGPRFLSIIGGWRVANLSWVP